MSEAEHRVETRRWLRYADEDLRAAEASLAISGVQPRHICWLAQQAAEKALKAILIFEQVEYPRRHDLDLLLTLAPAGWMVTSQAVDLSRLTEWSVEARYPGDWPEASDADASGAVETARIVYDSVAHDLARHRIGPQDAT